MEGFLDSSLENAFDAISLLLVFVTILFGIQYPRVVAALDEDILKDRPRELEKQQKKLIRLLIFKWTPVVFLTFLCAYSMMPLAIKTIVYSDLNLIDFDLLRTAFVMAWVFTIFFFFASLYIVIKIIRTINEIKRCLDRT